MADAGSILARIRAAGCNVILDGRTLQLINGNKLSDQARSYITKHRDEIASFLADEADFDERAAIMEFDGGLTRAVAEYMARLLLSKAPQGASAADWSWFVSQAAKVVDETISSRRAA